LVWFSPELRVTYWPRGRFSNLVKQFYSTGIWRGDLTRRDIGGASKRYFAPPVLVVALTAGLIWLAFGRIIGILPLAGYSAGILALAVTAKGLSLKSRIALVIVLPTMHLSWGVGFIKGFANGAGTTIDKGRLSGKAAGK
jgi:succinoglycan biosynthesis protein ExoA